ncbi:hypothetical protein BJH93_04100 [Kocuria polaris]|nr:hypothetical protein [Kocuria polaris]
MRGLTVKALAVGRRWWREISLADLDGSWAALAPPLVASMTDLQYQAAIASMDYSASALAEQGTYRAPDAFVNPVGFAGVAPDGRSLEALLYSPVTDVKTLIGAGMPAVQALSLAQPRMDRLTKTLVADAGRASAGVDIVARPRVDYVRMLQPPSCSRCVILAGRIYRGNEGFLRHPRCDCTHVPVAENRGGDMRTDPYEYFESLTAAEQDKAFGKANAQAVRDGADIYQVTNARRGVSYAGVSSDGTRRGQRASLTTTEATTGRGTFGRANGATRTERARAARLTPDAIYQQGLPRQETLRLLERNGYLLPGGQQAGGVIRGNHPGAGAKLSELTAAQQRVQTARLRWEAALAGRNPYGKGPPKPTDLATAEREYRRWLTTGGEIFTR